MPLSDVFSGEYEKWDGLPSWSIEEMAVQLNPVISREKALERVRAIHRFEVTKFERLNLPKRVELWVAKGDQAVSIVECSDVLHQYPEHSLALMGEPDLLLEDRILRVSYLVEDFVYVRRGIALSIGFPLDTSHTSGRTVLHVRLFPSMTKARYLTEVDDLGNSGTPRPIH